MLPIKKELSANGRTKENLIQLAKSYKDLLIKTGGKNAAELVRRDQVMDLLGKYF